MILSLQYNLSCLLLWIYPYDQYICSQSIQPFANCPASGLPPNHLWELQKPMPLKLMRSMILGGNEMYHTILSPRAGSRFPSKLTPENFIPPHTIILLVFRLLSSNRFQVQNPRNQRIEMDMSPELLGRVLGCFCQIQNWVQVYKI